MQRNSSLALGDVTAAWLSHCPWLNSHVFGLDAGQTLLPEARWLAALLSGPARLRGLWVVRAKDGTLASLCFQDAREAECMALMLVSLSLQR